MLSIPACLSSEGSLECAMKGEAHLGWITGWCSGFYSYRFLHMFPSGTYILIHQNAESPRVEVPRLYESFLVAPSLEGSATDTLAGQGRWEEMLWAADNQLSHWA